MKLLDNIRGHNDLVKLNEEERLQLCREIREFLVDNVSKTGGHLASNLGAVELTVAIETVFDTAHDRLVFDVGHQSYVHKLLTGRQADFAALRQYGGIAGFPKPNESNTDSFVAGHASSSVSIALGMARAKRLCKANYNVVTLLGDGAATGGMVYEALNDAGGSAEPMVVILNDNAMSIDNNVGGMASHLYRLRTKEKYLGIKEKSRNALLKIPGGGLLVRLIRNIKDVVRRMLLPTTIFENMGFTYYGPVDGHDVEELINLLCIAKQLPRPVLIHAMTQKGKGYAPAEEHPKLFHGVGKFDPVTGEVPAKSGKTFSDAFGEEMCRLAQEDSRLCAITAAMPGGTGLLDFKKTFPKRLYDVGIAEEHAMSMAGGLAKQGAVPVIALYSTFLQRAYDMIIQDVCMLRQHVVLAIDRAGLVGEDGETHHGVFDVGFLRQAPGMQILCPASTLELQDMLRWAVKKYDGPVAIRYPRGGDRDYTQSAWTGLDNTLLRHKEGADVTLLTYGTLLQNAMDAAGLLKKQGIHATVLRLLNVADLPIEEIGAHTSGPLVVLEETAANSGIAQALSYGLQNHRVYGMDLGADFVPHGSVNALYKHCGLDTDSIVEFVREVLTVEN